MFTVAEALPSLPSDIVYVKLLGSEFPLSGVLVIVVLALITTDPCARVDARDTVSAPPSTSLSLG